MGLASNFNNAIHQNLSAYAAWMPIVNTFKIGEFGVFQDGVFQSLGNIKDKYPEIEFKIENGNPADIDFTSSGTKTFKLDANGNSIASFAALGNADATLKIVFENENSCVIKAKLSSQDLKNIDEIATILAKKSNWRKKFSVVSRIYTGEKCVIVCSREGGTEVELKASADILQQIEGGKVQGGVQFKSNKESTFNAIGETGIVALSLFKLNIFSNVKVLDGEAPKFDIVEVKGEVQDDF
jgi:hypothetical protein